MWALLGGSFRPSTGHWAYVTDRSPSHHRTCPRDTHCRIPCHCLSLSTKAYDNLKVAWLWATAQRHPVVLPPTEPSYTDHWPQKVKTSEVILDIYSNNDEESPRFTNIKSDKPCGRYFIATTKKCFGFQQPDKAKNTKAKIAHANAGGKNTFFPRFGGWGVNTR